MNENIFTVMLGGGWHSPFVCSYIEYHCIFVTMFTAMLSCTIIHVTSLPSV